MNLSPAWGWLAIAVVVGAWDVSNERSLSGYAQKHWPVTAVVGGITLAHLTGILPDLVDPFDKVARLLGH